jgi:hypothetical protein
MGNIDNALRLDKDLTNIALGYKEGIDEGLFLIAPPISMPSNGKYPYYAKGALYYSGDSTRARYAKVKRLEYPTESWGSYACEEHPLEGLVDRQDRAKSRVQGMVYSSPESAAKGIKRALDQELGAKIISAIFSTTALASSYATPTIKWDLDGATPRDDLRTWYLAFKDNCGVAPNGFAISDRLLPYLGDGLRLKYGWTGGFNFDLIKGALNVDFGIPVNRFVIIHGEKYGTSSFANLITDQCLFFYSPPSLVDWEPSLAATIVPNDSVSTINGVGFIPPYEEPEQKIGTLVQGIREYDVVLLDQYAGYLGYNCANGF